jgi:hypothetical protein
MSVIRAETRAHEPEALLLRLLLADLPENERELLEKRLMDDDALFNELLAAEDDLIDAAVAGELDAVTQHLLATLPDLGRRLAFARALQGLAAARPAATLHRLLPGWQRRAPWLAMAAALVMALGLMLVQGLPIGMIDQGPDAETLQVVLPSSGLRGHTTELEIAAKIERVELFLELSSGLTAEPLRVVLQTGEGCELARWEEATATSYDWGTALRIDLPAAQLAPGTYSILVLDGRGQAGQVWEYTFTVPGRHEGCN